MPTSGEAVGPVCTSSIIFEENAGAEAGPAHDNDMELYSSHFIQPIYALHDVICMTDGLTVSLLKGMAKFISATFCHTSGRHVSREAD